ncbi:MAG TPA: enoyl-CoA hydratase-related protein [Steroidobacteraceae bacterium]|nr:enoyl-CoA hydratase-related protein [Steroidobacteraceae bacterium]
MHYEQILYEPAAVARITLNRPQYRNAQSARLIEELDDAFRRAGKDRDIQVIVLSGNGSSFSAGHDLGTPDELADRRTRNLPPGRLSGYIQQRELYVEATLRWRNVPKPTIAMVHGYCIYGGWIFAAAMDLVFAAEDALFLPSNLQYFTAPWDIGPKKAKEILFEGRFITAQEAQELGFVNRVFAPDDLERETLTYAARVAERGPMGPRATKFMINNVLDGMGYTRSVESNYETYAFGGISGPLPTEPPPDRPKRQLSGVAWALDLLRRGIPAARPQG